MSKKIYLILSTLFLIGGLFVLSCSSSEDPTTITYTDHEEPYNMFPPTGVGTYKESDGTSQCVITAKSDGSINIKGKKSVNIGNGVATECSYDFDVTKWEGKKITSVGSNGDTTANPPRIEVKSAEINNIKASGVDSLSPYGSISYFGANDNSHRIVISFQILNSQGFGVGSLDFYGTK